MAQYKSAKQRPPIESNPPSLGLWMCYKKGVSLITDHYPSSFNFALLQNPVIMSITRETTAEEAAALFAKQITGKNGERSHSY